ncbi:SRPBCC family protein [Streptomyces sp. SID13666]|uniref:SRPBCC family protein n=1 Tax=Streptomyces TaxID=1883 RepID=UPI0011073438|nr:MULTISPECIES: SRPBCC family protein [Streptomyces]MCZ4095050.1 SRPBCC family protein [Streptomyces sp. H39-C1]NEA52720.1 SRPBCC family protein [Streptomyces sp. SID13666]NEA69953.1 SRPBCC family protein [Streptomyces sp. SID13588]QNA71330.1 SRPBCC family protein [Streptomyces sp. So13.3]
MRIPRFPEAAATGTVTIRVPPTEAYRIISDPPVMIRFAEEAHRARWLNGAGTPAVGARFQGYNRNGLRRWATTCRITDADPARRFAYEVTAPLRIPISRWQYDIEPSAEGCTVTETNWLRVPLWFIPFAIVITGVFDRIGANNSNITTTLQRLKAHLESAPVS